MRSVTEFTNWPAGKSPEQIGELLTTNYLARPRGAYHYSDACTWYGALGFTMVTGDTTRNAQLVTNFSRYLSGAGYVPSGTTVDDRVSGIVPLEIFIQTQDSSRNYLSIGLGPASEQYGEYDPNLSRARYWVDDMFMITALQVQACRATGDVKNRDFAARDAELSPGVAAIQWPLLAHARVARALGPRQRLARGRHGGAAFGASDRADAGSDASQRQFYLDRPTSLGDLHGQAPVLWAANTLIRASR